jgi:hypothetical protein
MTRVQEREFVANVLPTTSGQGSFPAAASMQKERRPTTVPLSILLASFSQKRSRIESAAVIACIGDYQMLQRLGGNPEIGQKVPLEEFQCARGQVAFEPFAVVAAIGLVMFCVVKSAQEFLIL